MSNLTQKTKEHKREIIYHLVAWAFVFATPLLSIERNSGSINWIVVLVQMILPLLLFILFYINFLCLVPKLYFNNKRLIFYCSNVVLVIAAALFNYYIFRAIFPRGPRERDNDKASKIEMVDKTKAGNASNESNTSNASNANNETKAGNASNEINAGKNAQFDDEPDPNSPNSRDSRDSRHRHKRPMPDLFFHVRDIIALSFPVGLAVAIFANRRLETSEEARKEAELRQKEAELKNLRSQINPHFLLNTLNNIYALISFNTTKAQSSVLELSQLLRHVLYDNQQEYTPINKELDFLKNYVELMKIRVSANTTVSFNNQVQDGMVQIAPLIFISLIENAFKHGISPVEKSFIDINISECKGVVCCCVTNSNFPKNNGTDKSGSGIGLEQVSKRLELTYHGKYIWEKGVSDDKKAYTSKIIINTL